MTQFNWQTEEDIVWEALPEPEPPAPPPDRRRRLRIIGLLLLLFLVVGGVVYWQVNRRVAAATAAVSEDVLSSYNLVQRAAANQDRDLVQSLMSGRDMDWVGSVATLVAESAYLDRGAFELERAAGENRATIDEAEVILSPDLTEAEVIVPQSYSYLGDDGSEQQVILAQTAVYRRGSDRWLYSPPHTDFWGDRQTIESDLLTVRFHSRDQEVVESLASDLETHLETACQTVPDIDCGSGLFIDLNFSQDPITLATSLTSWEPMAEVENGWKLALPTPTLVGVPQDELGYEVLLRGYARALITAVLLHQAGWECCQGQAFATVLVDYELSRLALRRWPVSAADYQWVLAEEIGFAAIERFYRTSELPDVVPKRAIYTAVDFWLRADDNVTALDLLDKLQDGSPNFFVWLLRADDATPTNSRASRSLAALDNAWHLFAHTQRLGIEAAAPIAYPEQSLYQMCLSTNQFDDIEQVMLNRLSASRAEWELLEEFEGFTLMSPLPSGELLIQSLDTPDTSARTHLWQNGRLTRLNSTVGDTFFALGETDPPGRYLSYYSFNQVEQQPLHAALDLESCQASDCEQRLLPGVPAWSPQGQHGLFLVQEQPQLFGLRPPNTVLLFDPETALTAQDMPIQLGRADGRPFANETAPRAIGSGTAPFWLDEVTYGYLRADATTPLANDRDLVLATLADPTPKVILTHADLAPTVASSSIADRIELAYALPNPVQRSQLFVAGFDRLRQIVYVWLLDSETRALSLVASGGYSFGHSLSISPNGRFLLLQGADVNESNNPNASTLLLLDLETGESEQYNISWPFFAPMRTYDWSADGQWLAIAATPNRVALKALEHDYFELLPAGDGSCVAAMWLD